MIKSNNNVSKIRNFSRWGIAALPLGMFLGLVAGLSLGNVAIGIAIGTALGFGGAALLLAAVVVFRSTEMSEPS
jgi:hypothetical protein